MGLEPTHLSIPEPKSGAATNYAKGAKLLNKRMSNANVNLGVEALFNYASTDTYKITESWTTARDFVASYLVPPPGYAPGSSDFQSVAMTTSAKAA